METLQTCVACNQPITYMEPIRLKKGEKVGRLEDGDIVCQYCYNAIAFLREITTDIYNRVVAGEDKDLIALDIMKRFGKHNYSLVFDCHEGSFNVESFDVSGNNRTFFVEQSFHNAVFKTIEHTIIGTSNRLMKVIEKAEEARK